MHRMFVSSSFGLYLCSDVSRLIVSDLIDPNGSLSLNNINPFLYVLILFDMPDLPKTKLNIKNSIQPLCKPSFGQVLAVKLNSPFTKCVI